MSGYSRKNRRNGGKSIGYFSRNGCPGLTLEVLESRLLLNGSGGLEDDYVYQWTDTFGSSDSETGYDLATDSTGNIYVIGRFKGTVDFDPTSGTDEHSSNGDYDAFITKLNVDGSYGWTRTFGGSGKEGNEAVVVDSDGNIYMTGYFTGTVDFNPGGGTDEHTVTGEEDAFVVRLNANGSFGWAWTFGGDSWESGMDIALDLEENILVTGYYYSSTDFDPSGGTDIHDVTGEVDTFLTRFTSDGDYGQTVTIGGSNDDNVLSLGLAVDSTGNVLLSGEYSGTVDFDPTGGTDTHVANGENDIFVTKLNSDFSYGWTAVMGGAGQYDRGYDIVTDSSDNVYVTGDFENSFDFDPTGGTDVHTSAGGRDVFVTQLHSDGSYGWTVTFGSSGAEAGNNIAIDSEGHLFVTGFFTSDTVDFDPGPGTDNHSRIGGSDIYVTQLNTDGSYGWTAILGGTGAESCNAVTVDSFNCVLITGYFSETVDFDPTSGEDNYVSNGSSDVYVMKLSPKTFEVAAGIGGYQTVKYTDADGSAVSVKVSKGTADLMFSSDTFSMAVKGKTLTISGVVTLEQIELQSSDANTKITMNAKGGGDGEATVGGIAGGELGSFSGRKIDLVGDIDLTGALTSLMVDDIAAGVEVTVLAASAKGFTLKADAIGAGVEFVILDTVKRFQASTFSGSGLLDAGSIKQVDIKQGSFDAEVVSRTGEINTVTSGGDITGNINSADFIKKITSKQGDITGDIQAVGDIGTVTAYDYQGVVLSAGEDIQKVVAKNDMTATYILAGYDCSAGGMAGLGSGDVGSVSVKGIFSESCISAGVLPDVADLDSILSGVTPPYSGLGNAGAIGKVKFGDINRTATDDFGLWAADAIQSVKVGKDSFTESDLTLHFMVEDHLG